MLTRLQRSVIVVAVALLSAACGGVHLAPSGLSYQAKMRVPPPDKALIYVYRDESFGGTARLEVSLDAVIAGKTGPKTFFLFEVEPGKHFVSSEGENTHHILIMAEAGKTYFVWQEVKMGAFYAQTKLHVMDEIRGREGMRECELLQPRF